MKFNIKKIWGSLVQNIVNNVFWVLLVAVFGGSGIAWTLWPGFKELLKTVYTFTLPLWAWIFVYIAICGLPVIILKIIDLRRTRKAPIGQFLTDTQDIINKLCWWVGQQQHFVEAETRDHKLVTWHFSVIDKKLKLNSGSTKKFLPALFRANPKLFNITLINEGEETIAIHYGS